MCLLDLNAFDPFDPEDNEMDRVFCWTRYFLQKQLNISVKKVQERKVHLKIYTKLQKENSIYFNLLMESKLQINFY